MLIIEKCHSSYNRVNITENSVNETENSLLSSRWILELIFCCFNVKDFFQEYNALLTIVTMLYNISLKFKWHFNPLTNIYPALSIISP
jgi:hypothetical protein